MPDVLCCGNISPIKHTTPCKKSEDNFIAYKENSQVVSILQTFQQIMTKM
jgi:hypothetical protein